MPDSLTLTQSLRRATGLSRWAGSLVASRSSGASKTLEFLESGFYDLPSEKRRPTARRLEREDLDNVDALLHHLMVYEVCRRLGLQPTWEPKVENQTPDMTLLVHGKTFLGEVFLTDRPEKTRSSSPGDGEYKDCGEAAKKIADTIGGKALTYARTGYPLVIFVVYANRDVESLDLEVALYGLTVGEIDPLTGVTEDVHDRRERHGALCPPDKRAAHQHLSAVVGCDWFDTLNREDPGRRLHLVVYHHWSPTLPLPVGAFEPFRQVVWRDTPTGGPTPLAAGVWNNVLRTDDSHELDIRPYAADQPW